MTDSKDGDKTTIKPTPPADDGRTRVAKRPTPPTQANSSASDDEKTRMPPRKPVNDGAPRVSNSARSDVPVDDEKTRMAPRKAIDDDGKTRTAARKPVLPQTPPSESSDKTRFVAPSKNAKPVVSDATVITVNPGALDADAPGYLDPGQQAFPILKNRFVFEELLGSGGMGAVYKAKDLLKIEAQDREPYVAIKVLSDEFKSHPEAFMALQRESRKSQKIAHPNIVNVHDFDRDGDTVFMTMEYMEGKPLDKLISQYRGIGLPLEDVLKILSGICAALTYAHAQKIIHSDFKPGNIFVGLNGVAKVFDFGIARAVAKAENREESLDDKTVFDAGKLGALTPAYASLEMLEGKTPDVRDDVYALGCIAYELFTGEHPYNRVHADEAKRRKLKPKKIPGIKKHQWLAIERAIAFERENRTESVEEFWREFNKKTSYTLFIVIALIVGMVVGGLTYYKYRPVKPAGLTEAQFRDELEQKLRLELKMNRLIETLKATDFSSAVEAQLWEQIQELRQLMGKTHEWLVKQEAEIYKRYVKEIDVAIANGDLTRAQMLVKNAYRYATDTAKLREYEASIAALLEAKKQADAERLAREGEQQKQQKVVAQEKQQADKESEAIAVRNNSFSVALGSVDKQLECKNNLDMKDFEIAITKLRSLNLQQYQKEEPRIIRSLAQCIQYIGGSFPERAEADKTYALRIFVNNPIIAAITILQKDPCSSSLAGIGARGLGASCKDKMSGVSRVPVLVVIPAKAGIKGFAIGKYEVSTDEFNDFCKQTKSCTAVSVDDSSIPATNISYASAVAYTKWLSEKSNRKYRLPTFNEWQYAAKGTSGKIDQNRNCKLNSRGIQKGGTLIKSSLGQQNDWGLVNYVGNAREWVIERDGGVSAVGGSYDTPIEECDLNNHQSHSGSADEVTGFRIVRELVE
ncbi:MAG: protein kinase [Gammaproteobacteria bacterium]|nr:MAG: protein kinase [Gammaproteobacteria bacterium]